MNNDELAKMIPDEVEAAAAREYTALIYKGNATTAEFRAAIRSTIAAALNAWPHGAVCHYTIADLEGWEMVLPLPQKDT